MPASGRRKVREWAFTGRRRGGSGRARVPVHTAWDIGRHSTAIWFFQVVGPEVRVIDFYESHGQYAEHYCGVVSACGYLQGKDYVPHDERFMSGGPGRQDSKH
jgi:predicted methyltransferase